MVQSDIVYRDVSLGNQLVTSEIRKEFHALFLKGEENYSNFDKTQVELFLDFTSMPFDYFVDDKLPSQS